MYQGTMIRREGIPFPLHRHRNQAPVFEVFRIERCAGSIRFGGAQSWSDAQTTRRE